MSREGASSLRQAGGASQGWRSHFRHAAPPVGANDRAEIPGNTLGIARAERACPLSPRRSPLVPAAEDVPHRPHETVRPRTGLIDFTDPFASATRLSRFTPFNR